MRVREIHIQKNTWEIKAIKPTFFIFFVYWVFLWMVISSLTKWFVLWSIVAPIGIYTLYKFTRENPFSFDHKEKLDQQKIDANHRNHQKYYFPPMLQKYARKEIFIHHFALTWFIKVMGLILLFSICLVAWVYHIETNLLFYKTDNLLPFLAYIWWLTAMFILWEKSIRSTYYEAIDDTNNLFIYQNIHTKSLAYWVKKNKVWGEDFIFTKK